MLQSIIKSTEHDEYGLQGMSGERESSKTLGTNLGSSQRVVHVDSDVAEEVTSHAHRQNDHSMVEDCPHLQRLN